MSAIQGRSRGRGWGMRCRRSEIPPRAKKIQLKPVPNWLADRYNLAERALFSTARDFCRRFQVEQPTSRGLGARRPDLFRSWIRYYFQNPAETRFDDGVLRYNNWRTARIQSNLTQWPPSANTQECVLSPGRKTRSMSSAWNVAMSLTPKNFAIWRSRKPSRPKKQKPIPEGLDLPLKATTLSLHCRPPRSASARPLVA